MDLDEWLVILEDTLTPAFIEQFVEAGRTPLAADLGHNVSPTITDYGSIITLWCNTLYGFNVI